MNDTIIIAAIATALVGIFILVKVRKNRNRNRSGGRAPKAIADDIPDPPQPAVIAAPWKDGERGNTAVPRKARLAAVAPAVAAKPAPQPPAKPGPSKPATSTMPPADDGFVTIDLDNLGGQA